MADETPVTPAVPPTPDSIPITDPTASQNIPIDLNPEYDPAKDTRPAFQKVNLNPKGPTIEAAPEPSLIDQAKKVVTEGIPRYSSRTPANPKYGQEQILALEEFLTPAEQRAHPIVTGVLEAVGGLTSPAMIDTVAATAGLGEAPAIVSKVASALFAGQIAKSVYDQYPALQAAVDKAQHAKTPQEHDDAFSDAQKILTHMGVDTAFGLLAAKHGAEGAKDILDATTGSGVPDQASTFKAPKGPAAPEPEETHPEMNRETVKSLQKLGYSNQHITNFNISEIRDILKNNTPASEYKPAAAPAPEPDKFADIGGKLVTPAPKAEGLEKPSPAAEKTPESEDAIEPLIMSDKIGGKKVRGALPNLGPPPADSKLLYHYTTQPFDTFDPMIGGTKGDFGTHLGTLEQAHGRMQGAGKSIIGTKNMVGEDIGGHIRPVYANIKNALRLEDEGNFKPAAVARQMQEKGIISKAEGASLRTKTGGIDPTKLRDMIERKGFDGIVYLNRTEGMTQQHADELATVDHLSDDELKFAAPETADSYIALRPEQITPKYTAPRPEAFAEHGGKFVGQQPAKTPFSGTHYSSIPVEGATLSGATRGKAAAGSEKDRLQHPNKVPGVYVYREGATPEPQIGGRANKYPVVGDKAIADISGAQKTMFQQAHADAFAKYKAAGDNDTIASQKALNDAEAHLRDAGFDGYEHKESGTGSVFLFGDQPIGSPDMLTPELQSPLKEKYNVKITENDGTAHTEPIEAFSPKKAIAVAQKKFPDTRAYSWEIEKFEERPPSTEYSVPTEKLAKMPESAGRSERHTMNHEFGHAMVGQNEGLQQNGVLSASHPSVRGFDARAAVSWPGRTIFDLPARQVNPKKLASVIKTMMGGIAADEVFNDVPRSANHNFMLSTGGDGSMAYRILQSTGLSHDDAMTYIHKAIDDAKAYLTQPEVAGIIKENAGVRESGLSRQYHVSPERMTAIHQEAQRRIANAKNQPADTGVNDDRANGPSGLEVSSTDVPRTEGGSTQGTEEGVSNKSIISEDKKQPFNTAFLDQLVPSGEDQDPRDVAKLAEKIQTSGRFDPIEVLKYEGDDKLYIEDGNHRYAAAKMLGYKDVPIDIINQRRISKEKTIDEEKIKKTPKPLPEVAPNEKLQASAQKYAKAHGMPEINHEHVEADPEHAKEIAKIYDAAKHDPTNPRVKAAYDALKSETLAQFHHLRDDLGLKFKPQEEDPYNSAEDMMDDIRKKNQLKVFTESSVGPDHPLAAIAPGAGGQTYNTIFRWVHDALGHAAGGNDFSENGEKSATEAHAQMYSDTARPAMRNETEGQTSWFFHNPEIESGAKQPGEFAPQKANILPDVSLEWHKTASEMADQDEAGGINPRTGKSDSKGMGTELISELRQPLDHTPTAEDFKNFYNQHKEIFDKHPELRVGWDNKSAVQGGHEINIGAVGPDAARVAKKLDQKSAFNIAKGEVVPTGGSGLRTEFPNYPIEDRIRDLTNQPYSARLGFEHLSSDIYDNLEPDERKYVEGDKTLQRNVMAQYHKISPSVAETTNAMQAGAALGGWWRRYIDVFHGLMGEDKTTPTWFQGSKVVDDHGQPKTVYHGSTASEAINRFEGDHYAGWFAENPEHAAMYAANRFGDRTNASIYPSQLAIKRPLDLSVIDLNADIDLPEFSKITAIPEQNIEAMSAYDPTAKNWQVVNSPEFVDYIRSMGYDGVKAKESGNTTWAALDSGQIKSKYSIETIASTIGPSHAEVLKQWHAALSANKNVADANNLAWHSYADWLDAGKPTDRKSIDDIIRKNGSQPEGRGKKGNAAISDTIGKHGKIISEGIDTSKIYNLVNSPEMRGERPFSGDVFNDDEKNPLMGKGAGYRKVPSMGATVAGKGNLNRLVIDTHIADFYGQKPGASTSARYIADSVHLRQAAKALGLQGGEGQEQLWGTVLGLKTLLKEGLTPEEAGSTLNAATINKIGKDYAEVIANDPEITQPGGILDRLKEKYGIGVGSSGAGAAYRAARSTSPSTGEPSSSQAPINPALTAESARRIRGTISESKIKKPSAPTIGTGSETTHEDTSFNFGANVKSQAKTDEQIVAEMMKAKTAAMKKGLSGLSKPSKK